MPDSHNGCWLHQPLALLFLTWNASSQSHVVLLISLHGGRVLCTCVRHEGDPLVAWRQRRGKHQTELSTALGGGEGSASIWSSIYATLVFLRTVDRDGALQKFARSHGYPPATLLHQRTSAPRRPNSAAATRAQSTRGRFVITRASPSSIDRSVAAQRSKSTRTRQYQLR